VVDWLDGGQCTRWTLDGVVGETVEGRYRDANEEEYKWTLDGVVGETVEGVRRSEGSRSYCRLTLNAAHHRFRAEDAKQR
jgi:hypothetical protein